MGRYIDAGPPPASAARPFPRGPPPASQAWPAIYYTILYYTILYYTILYYTILHYTVLYCRARKSGPAPLGGLRIYDNVFVTCIIMSICMYLMFIIFIYICIYTYIYIYIHMYIYIEKSGEKHFESSIPAVAIEYTIV